MRKKRKEVKASVPARRSESPGLDARTSELQLQKSSGGVGSQIRTHAALPKEWRCE